MAQSHLQRAHILLYISSGHSWLEHPDQVREIEEFLQPKRGAPGGHDVEWIFGYEVSPVRRQRAQAASAVMEPSPVLTPVLAPHDQIKFLADQGVVRVCYAETSSLNVTMWCS